MLHKARARNARPYGYGGIMRSSFFRNIVGARIARPLLEFVQNFGFAHLLSRNSSILSFAERAGALRLKLNISRNKCLSILDMGLCPIVPPKGFRFRLFVSATGSNKQKPLWKPSGANTWFYS